MIEVSDVTISTVTVTIQALKVNNRQMTQAVFNQLPVLQDLINPIDDDGVISLPFKIDGNVWGWVNHLPKTASHVWSSAGNPRPALQFVVERHGQLYRAPVWPVLLDPKNNYPMDDRRLREALGPVEYCKAMNEVLERIRGFPQLFIAV